MVKNLCASEGDLGSIPQEDSLEEEMAILSSIFAWGNPMDREPLQVIVHGVTKESDMI